jgi:membrane fusion protein
MSGLFRNEALQARQDTGFGRVVVQAPLSLTVWCVFATGCAAAVIALLVFGQYTKRTRVPGITVPVSGLVKLVSPQPGIVVERRIEEGQAVAAGDVLFVLSSERRLEEPDGSRGAQAEILEQLRHRRESLEAERVRRARLHDEQMKGVERRLATLRQEAVQLRQALATQAAREASAEEQAARYDELARRGFVSALTARQRRDETLEQTARRQSLERGLLTVRRDVESTLAELGQLPLHAEQQQAQLARELSTLQQEMVAAAAAGRVVVTAPQAGVVTAIAAERGQTVGHQPLATLLPGGAAFEAHLFAPSRAVGFVEAGQKVRVRYAAYPFQKFGQYEGEVAHVSRVALEPAELPAQAGLPAHAEPLYRITVRLASSHVMAYGRPQFLTAGMQLEADVMQDRRRLIEWVFEPLIALGRRT